MLLRRACVAAFVAGAGVPAAAHDDEATAAARLPQRVALLAHAQAELERGNAGASLDDFERAAMMLHAADAELGLIRAAMQDGQYRRALAFCAHTAGEHTDDSEGAALYAWLLRIGGQPGQSDRVLVDLRAHASSDPLAAAVDAAFASSPAVAAGLLREPAHRMAPWPVMRDGQSPPPSSAHFAGNAVLVDGGGAALVPTVAFASGALARLWVRNGLGQATEATLDRTDVVLESAGLARLHLRSALPIGGSRESAGRAPFAGSPGYAVQFGADAAPAWPTLSQGFLGGPVDDTGTRKLGFAALPGAPVLDAKGVLIGITLAGASSTLATWMALSSLAPPATSAVPESQSHAGLALVAPDEIYEAGLRRSLQMLVDAP
jgi:hypothetical protein